MGKLTVAKMRALSEPGMYGDGGTFYLRVSPGGSKSWIQRLVFHGRRRDIGLGGWPLTTLTEAREMAFENRLLAQRGGDPLAERRKTNMPTFQEAAKQTFEANRPRWRNDKVAKTWLRQLERHTFPVMGEMPVDQVGREDVLRVLTPIWTRKPEVARKLRQRIRATLRWTEAHGFVDFNPAGEAIDGALPIMHAVRRHFRTLPYGEVAAALEAVESTSAVIASKLCFCLLILTAARSGEARGVAWEEMHGGEREWRIPRWSA